MGIYDELAQLAKPTSPSRVASPQPERGRKIFVRTRHVESFDAKATQPPSSLDTPAKIPALVKPQPAQRQVIQAPVVPVDGLRNETSTPSPSMPSSISARTETASRRDTTTPRHHATTVSRYHDAIIELLRKAVKEFGKEAATHRFTVEEKRALADLIYSYARQGMKTSENEIARIAVNFILSDYQKNGENSILHKVLLALNE